jgi:hypothetical protein
MQQFAALPPGVGNRERSSDNLSNFESQHRCCNAVSFTLGIDKHNNFIRFSVRAVFLFPKSIPNPHSASLFRNSQLRLAFLSIGDSHMPKGPFIAFQFVPTEWSSAADKAPFGNTFLHFVESFWKRSLFTKGFYQRLSNCFGHIAHYDIHGFYETWFTSDRDRLEFLKNASKWPCYGDPKFTFSDVERALRQQIQSRNYVALYELRAAEELRSAEMTILRSLEAKHRTPTVTPPSEVEPQGEVSSTSPTTSTEAIREPVQICLF